MIRTCNMVLFFFCLLGMGRAGLCEEISVAPGDGTIALALEGANAGDVLVLGRGVFAANAILPGGVSIRGAGAGATRLTVASVTALQCPAGENTISRLEIAGALGAPQMGITARGPVRIENVRFVNLRAGVRLNSAPLSDVVACEFEMCEIGVRAMDGASPTVWGCRFEKCMLGVFSAEGAPLISNNFFHTGLAGVQIFAGARGRMAIVRNNLFWRVGRYAVEVHQRTDPAEAPSVRNNMARDCRRLMMSTEQLADRLSHVLVINMDGPLLRDRNRMEIAIDEQDREIRAGEAGLSIDQDGVIAVSNLANMRWGVREGFEKKGTRHWIGLEPAWFNPGLGTPASAGPGRRYGDAKLIVVNGVVEEEQVLARRGIGMGDVTRSVDNDAGTIEYRTAEGEVIRFDGRRYLGEAELQPSGPAYWSKRAGGSGVRPEGGD